MFPVSQEASRISGLDGYIWTNWIYWSKNKEVLLVRREVDWDSSSVSDCPTLDSTYIGRLDHNSKHIKLESRHASRLMHPISVAWTPMHPDECIQSLAWTYSIRSYHTKGIHTGIQLGRRRPNLRPHGLEMRRSWRTAAIPRSSRSRRRLMTWKLETLEDGPGCLPAWKRTDRSVEFDGTWDLRGTLETDIFGEKGHRFILQPLRIEPASVIIRTESHEGSA